MAKKKREPRENKGQIIEVSDFADMIFRTEKVQTGKRMKQLKSEACDFYALFLQKQQEERLKKMGV